jgi:hypothetical protein
VFDKRGGKGKNCGNESQKKKRKDSSERAGKEYLFGKFFLRVEIPSRF